MKKKIMIVLVLLVLFGIFIAGKALLADVQNTSGRIRITSTPSTTVFVDNVAAGKTPYEDKMKVGEYLIKLIPDGEASSTASWQGKVMINKNSLTFVNRELGASDVSSAGEIFTINPMDKAPQTANTGEIAVDTEPSGAIVYLDNDEKGVSSLVLQDVPKGDHELSVFMPGFLRRTQKVNVETGYRVHAQFSLAIDSTQQTAVTPTTPVASSSATQGKTTVTVKDTPTGWLRVRESPSLSASESGKVNTGDTFDLLDEQDGWYKIKTPQGDGWVSSVYTEKKTQ